MVAFSQMASIAGVSRVLFFMRLYEYVHVGCTIQNVEWRLEFSSLDPNLIMLIGCKVFLKIEVWSHKEELSELMCWRQHRLCSCDN